MEFKKQLYPEQKRFLDGLLDTQLMGDLQYRPSTVTWNIGLEIWQYRWKGLRLTDLEKLEGLVNFVEGMIPRRV